MVRVRRVSARVMPKVTWSSGRCRLRHPNHQRRIKGDGWSTCARRGETAQPQPAFGCAIYLSEHGDSPKVPQIFFHTCAGRDGDSVTKSVSTLPMHLGRT